ncbi:HIT-like protein [Microthyrium microscopicum]|uniref:HIT-like protein n=1 Tax=Microthyrium microscopicum TaxID=703497 RepID=A0A6A6U0V3_9PEZI|nr:HIT-like protein [Microthyrium microscopicum]
MDQEEGSAPDDGFPGDQAVEPLSSLSRRVAETSVTKRFARIQASEDSANEYKYVDHPTHPLSNYLAPSNYNRTYRDALIQYILHPEINPEQRVISYDDDWVLLKDAYPKSKVHFLLMSRNPQYYRPHPFIALRDEKFLESAKRKAKEAVVTAAAELRRMLCEHSALEKERMEAMMADELPDELPPGRDWTKEFKVGVHTFPSMSHLHIHIISKDNMGEYMKTGHHYKVFNTSFLAQLDEFPLSENDPRWEAQTMNYSPEMVCWRCKKKKLTRNNWTAFNSHLAAEYKEWRKE